MALEGTYGLKFVTATVDGVPISAYSDGDAISIEYDEQDWEKVTGADGAVVRVRTDYPGGTITLTLHPQSDSYDYLLGLAKVDRETGQATAQIQIVDLNENEGVFARQAWLEKLPDKEFNRDLGTREFVYQCASIETLG